MEVVSLLQSALAQFAVCRRSDFSESAFVDAMSSVTYVFAQYPQAWQEVEECWGVYGIDEAAIRQFGNGQGVPGMDARTRVITTLDEYLRVLLSRLPATPPTPSSSGWGEASHSFGMFDAMQQTMVGQRAVQVSKPLAREVSRTETETKLQAISAPKYVSQEVSRKLSGTRMFAVDDPAPDTSGAFAKIEDQPPAAVSEVHAPAIDVVKAILEALEMYDGDPDEWRLFINSFRRHFSADIIQKLLRDSVVTHEQLMHLVDKGANESQGYARFRSVFVERMRAFLTLRLLELSKEEIRYWDEIIRIARKRINAEEWLRVIGPVRQPTPVRGAVVTGPNAQEVSRAYRHLIGVFKPRLSLPW